jgi:NADH dehydrogenase (ubiquinone) 1 alpha subcomplex subunit 13
MTGTGQDMPPTGGFGPILYRRHLPKRGPPGWVLLTGAFGVIFTGLYLRSQGVHINRYS